MSLVLQYKMFEMISGRMFKFIGVWEPALSWYEKSFFCKAGVKKLVAGSWREVIEHPAQDDHIC